MTQSNFDAHSVAAALASGGALARDYEAAWSAIWTQSLLPAQLLELCRLRLARFHGARTEMAARNEASPAQEKIDALIDGSYFQDPSFSEAERAALEFTEIYAQDPAAISDELADAVKQHYGEPGLVCLVQALGFIDGRIRLALMYGALAANATH